MSETLGASFKIDVSNLQAGLKQANKLIRETESEFKRASAGMDSWNKSEEGLKAKISQLNSTTEIQREKVRALKEEYNRLIAEGMDPTSQKAVELRTQINNEEASLRKNEAELERTTQALEELGEEAEDTGHDFEKFGEFAKKACKVALEALTAVTVALGAVGKSAIESYAEYEQLVGGVETLFGDASEKMLEYANDAYRTAGMSANVYLDTAMSFASALVKGCEGNVEIASELANQAMIDMSDNANKFGSDLQSIQNAYMGFAKGQYNMLDNLKLGYGGTKEQMEKLIEDANKLKEASGEVGDLSIENMADIIEAIHLIQEEMDITGTTMLEATTTIQGSMGMLKGAWQNMLTAIADGGDWDKAMNGLVESASAVFDNLFPRITATLEGMGKAISELAPIIIEKLPAVIQQVVPALISTAGTLITTLIGALINAIPAVLGAGAQIMDALAEGILNASETLMSGGADGAIHSFILQLTSHLSDFIESGVKLITALATGLAEAFPVIMEYVPVLIESLFNAIVNNLPVILEAGAQIIVALVKGTIQALPSIISTMGTIAKKAGQTILKFSWLNIGKQIIEKFINGIKNMISPVVSTAKQIPKAVKDGIGSLITDAKKWGSDMIQNFIDGITAKMTGLLNKVKGMANDIKGYLHFSVPDKGPLKDADTWMPDMIDLFAGGIEKNKYKLTNSVRGLASSIGTTMHGATLGGFEASGATGTTAVGGGVVVNQTNNYSQAHSRYEIYKSKQATASAVRLALRGV